MVAQAIGDKRVDQAAGASKNSGHADRTSPSMTRAPAMPSIRRRSVVPRSPVLTVVAPATAAVFPQSTSPGRAGRDAQSIAFFMPPTRTVVLRVTTRSAVSGCDRSRSAHRGRSVLAVRPRRTRGSDQVRLQLHIDARWCELDGGACERRVVGVRPKACPNGEDLHAQPAFTAATLAFRTTSFGSMMPPPGSCSFHSARSPCDRSCRRARRDSLVPIGSVPYRGSDL